MKLTAVILRQNSNARYKQREKRNQAKVFNSQKKSNFLSFNPKSNLKSVSHCQGPTRASHKNFHFFLISSIKSSTGTKCISTISCRNRKACVFFFGSNSIKQQNPNASIKQTILKWSYSFH